MVQLQAVTKFFIQEGVIENLILNLYEASEVINGKKPRLRQSEYENMSACAVAVDDMAKPHHGQ
jgi:hypothetical protein